MKTWKWASCPNGHVERRAIQSRTCTVCGGAIADLAPATLNEGRSAEINQRYRAFPKGREGVLVVDLVVPVVHYERMLSVAVMTKHWATRWLGEYVPAPAATALVRAAFANRVDLEADAASWSWDDQLGWRHRSGAASLWVNGPGRGAEVEVNRILYHAAGMKVYYRRREDWRGAYVVDIYADELAGGNG